MNFGHIYEPEEIMVLNEGFYKMEPFVQILIDGYEHRKLPAKTAELLSRDLDGLRKETAKMNLGKQNVGDMLAAIRKIQKTLRRIEIKPCKHGCAGNCGR
ncbi:MAG: hypothetical protein FWD15_06135 [Alphaproteobacteria bacterium]|nr:hypothetical protein [Alphaproteobacteria bacterium]